MSFPVYYCVLPKLNPTTCRFPYLVSSSGVSELVISPNCYTLLVTYTNQYRQPTHYLFKFHTHFIPILRTFNCCPVAATVLVISGRARSRLLASKILSIDLVFGIWMHQAYRQHDLGYALSFPGASKLGHEDFWSRPAPTTSRFNVLFLLSFLGI